MVQRTRTVEYTTRAPIRETKRFLRWSPKRLRWAQRLVALSRRSVNGPGTAADVLLFSHLRVTFRALSRLGGVPVVSPPVCSG
jgi:hypothetical protein